MLEKGLKNMLVIGITGGVGAGKTEILNYIRENYNCRVLMADEAAKRLQEPGQECYEEIAALLGTGALQEDGHISRERMAERIFRDGALLDRINAIVHPAVKKYILREIGQEREKGKTDFFFLEAALLIECGYDAIVDEMWYIFTEEEVRRKRLKAARGYTDEKIDGILRAQLTDEVYRRHCGFVIDNSGELAYACGQIDRKMGEYLWRK